MRLAERAGPGRLHGIDRGKPALDDLERRQHLGSEEILFRRHERLGAQHLEGVVRHLGGAEAGLAAPDREHNVAWHAVALFDQREHPGVGALARPCAGGDGANDLVGEIAGGRTELGLMLLLGRRRFLAGHDEVRQLQVRLHADEGGIEGFFGDAPGFGLGPEVVLQPCLKLVVDGGGGDRDQSKKHRQQNDDPQPDRFEFLHTPFCPAGQSGRTKEGGTECNLSRKNVCHEPLVRRHQNAVLDRSAAASVPSSR